MTAVQNAPEVRTHPPRPKRKGNIGSSSSPWLFAAPGLLVYAAFLVYPALRSAWLSLTSWDGISATKSFVGLENYRAMLGDPVVHTAVLNNLLWIVVTIAVPMVVGLLLAVSLDSSVFARPLLRTVFYAPAVLPLVSVGTIWTWLYDPTNGAVNEALRDIGLGAFAQSWFGDSTTAVWAAMVPACWVRSGFPLLLYLAALQNIPRELYESAQVDGASAWQRFRRITLPSLRSTHYIVAALSVIEAVKVFDLVYAMTNGGPGNSTQVLGTWMFFNVFQFNQAGYGAAIAVLATAVTLAIGIPYVWKQTKD
jgi:raffinose/stachyose/melibiose transport system permease protein